MVSPAGRADHASADAGRASSSSPFFRKASWTTSAITVTRLSRLSLLVSLGVLSVLRMAAFEWRSDGPVWPTARPCHRNRRLSLSWLVLLFTGLVLLFLLPFAWILTLLTLLAALMAGLIALLLLAPVRLVPLVPKVLLLLVSLFFLGRVHL